MTVPDRIQGMGFVPGRACGPLKRRLPTRSQQIALISQAQIAALAARRLGPDQDARRVLP